MSEIHNVTKKTVLSSTIRLLTSSSAQARGLMFSKKKSDFGLVFPMRKMQKIPIHMVFVFYSIDVLWLDSDKRVVDFRSHCPPFHLFISHSGKAMYLVEVCDGSISKSKTKIGDKLEW